jgi:hypothetical protein
MSLLDDDQMKTLGFDIAISLQEDLFSGIKADEDASMTSPEYLMWMIKQITEYAAVMDADKIHRWIGYIQGVAIVTSLTSLDRERERVVILRKNLR